MLDGMAAMKGSSMKAQKWIKWLMVNAAFAVVAYYGLFKGVGGAANVVQLYVWFVFILSLFLLSDDFVRSVQKKNGLPLVPAWLDVSFDILVVVALAWSGWMWSAAAYLMHITFFSRLRTALPEASNT